MISFAGVEDIGELSCPLEKGRCIGTDADVRIIGAVKLPVSYDEESLSFTGGYMIPFSIWTLVLFKLSLVLDKFLKNQTSNAMY